jgi:hypothetical protein
MGRHAMNFLPRWSSEFWVAFVQLRIERSRVEFFARHSELVNEREVKTDGLSMWYRFRF